MRHLVLGAVLSIAACDRVFIHELPPDGPLIDAPDAAPDAPGIDAPPPCFRDPFTTSFDPRWVISEPGSTASIGVMLNELRITLPPNMTASNALEIVGEDLRDGSAEVELAAAPPPSGTAGCQFRVVDNIMGKQYVFFTVSGMLFAHVDGATDVMVPYSPTTHRWLRIRHVALTQQVVFETASSNKIWTGFRTVSATLQVANVRVGLVAVEVAATATPGFASFDDFVIRKPSCSSPP